MYHNAKSRASSCASGHTPICFRFGCTRSFRIFVIEIGPQSQLFRFATLNKFSHCKGTARSTPKRSIASPIFSAVFSFLLLLASSSSAAWPSTRPLPKSELLANKYQSSALRICSPSLWSSTMSKNPDHADDRGSQPEFAVYKTPWHSPELSTWLLPHTIGISLLDVRVPRTRITATLAP